MMSCKECKERLYPDDPSVPIGRYHHSACDYFCDKPLYYRELEETHEPIESPQPTNREILEKLHRGEVLKNELQNRLNKHIDASKKKKEPEF